MLGVENIQLLIVDVVSLRISLDSYLYWTRISAIEANTIVNQKFSILNIVVLKHDHLGHHGSISSMTSWVYNDETNYI